MSYTGSGIPLVFCSRCGAANSDVARFCSGCGADLAVAAAPPGTGFRYSGFWKRFVAMIIDSFVLTPIGLVLFASTGVFSILAHPQDLEGMLAAMFGVTFVAMLLLMMAGNWLYHTLMESSHYQATLGKLAIGAKVTDLNGSRISFVRANGRFFGKFISSMIFNIGFLMAAFTDRKQAMHDILAGCLVIQK